MQICELVFFYPVYPEVAYRLSGDDDGLRPENLDVTSTVRTVFPETWIWDLAEVG